MSPPAGTPRFLLSVTFAAALLAMGATSGDSEGDRQWPPEGYADRVVSDFILAEPDEVLELAFDGVGEHWGNPDDDGVFRWRLRVDLAEGAGPGHALLWDCVDETDIDEARWQAGQPMDSVDVELRHVPEDCRQSSTCEDRVCVRITREGEAAVSGTWTVWVTGGEGLDYSAYVREVRPDPDSG